MRKTRSIPHERPVPGIRANVRQFALQLVQVFFVGLTLGMTRTVVPAVAEEEFGLPRQSAGLIATFVIAFGVVKAVMNFLAGRASERLGRKRVLVVGWLIALPIPFMILFGPSWTWIVLAMILLGINQGLTWSMTITSKLDLTRDDQRGLANGLNEFFGYFAVAVAGVATAYLSARFGARTGLFVFGMATVIPALTMAALLVQETRPHDRAASSDDNNSINSDRDRAGSPSSRTFFAICQAGLIEKFTDAFVWIVVPIHLNSRGYDLPSIGWICGCYATVWGVSQLVTGPLSDRIGRRAPIGTGMFLCALGVAMMTAGTGMMWWTLSAALTGLGMGLLYPTLGAAVSDLAPPSLRGTKLGIYRFWRDLGYGVGAACLGAAIHVNGVAAFWLVTVSMTASAAVFVLLASETHRQRGAAKSHE
jgi:MFS family permease